LINAKGLGLFQHRTVLVRHPEAAFFTKLRRESVANGDFSGAEGAFKKAPLSALAAAGFMKYAG
jgi:hypothetical protein